MIERNVRSTGHGFAAFTLVLVQTLTWACSSRAGAVPAQPGPAPQQQAAAPPTAEATPDAGPDECALLPLAGEPIATVGLTDRVDPSNALHPSNPSERLLFGQLYETLVRVDCMGRVRPGLAASWRLAPDGRLWMITLRENARFSDGTPVTAAAVRAGWIRDGADRPSLTYVSQLVEMVDVLDDRTLLIQLADRRSLDAPITLAHPHLAVARKAAESPWPLGTRSSRIEQGIDAAGGIASSELTVGRDHLPPLRFLLARRDPRDLLDAAVDLLITRDAATLAYAGSLPHFERVPLAWQRTHVFLASGRSPSSPTLTEDARRALAVDAVRGEARGAQGPFWFETANCHLGPPAGIREHVPTPRIVYDGNDAAARDLAERFVALAAASHPAATPVLDALLPDRPRRTFQRATGLTDEALANARRGGTDAGYIAAIDSRPLDPCPDLETLLTSFPWLTRTAIVPLVNTRLRAVVRRGRSGLTTDFDGSVVIDDVNNPRTR